MNSDIMRAKISLLWMPLPCLNSPIVENGLIGRREVENNMSQHKFQQLIK